MKVKREPSEDMASWTLRNPPRATHYFTVFSAGSHKEDRAPGVRTFVGMGREPTVTYMVRVQRGFFGKRAKSVTLELRGDKETTALPSLLLVGKKGVPAITPRAGYELFRLDCPVLTRGSLSVPIPEEHWGAGSFLKLFIMDDETTGPVRLVPSEATKLRLG